MGATRAYATHAVTVLLYFAGRIACFVALAVAGDRSFLSPQLEPREPPYEGRVGLMAKYQGCGERAVQSLPPSPLDCDCGERLGPGLRSLLARCKTKVSQAAGFGTPSTTQMSLLTTSQELAITSAVEPEASGNLGVSKGGGGAGRPAGAFANRVGQVVALSLVPSSGDRHRSASAALVLRWKETMYRVPYAKALIVVGTVWLADVVAGHSAELTREAIDNASFSEWSEKRTSEDPNPFLIRVQVLLDRADVSPGVIDGFMGDNLTKAVRTFEEQERRRLRRAENIISPSHSGNNRTSF